MNDSFPHVKRIDSRITSDRADHHEIVVAVTTWRKENDHDIEHETVHQQHNQWEIMNKQTLPPGRDPSIVKDQNVSFDRRPGEEHRVCRVQTPIDELPHRTEDRRSFPITRQLVVVQHPRIDGQQTDQTNDENHGDHVIVQGTTKGSIEEKVVENEEGAENRRNEKDDVRPEFGAWSSHE